MSAKNNLIDKMEVIKHIVQSVDNLRLVLLDLKDHEEQFISEKSDYLYRIIGYAFTCDNKDDLRMKILEEILNE